MREREIEYDDGVAVLSISTISYHLTPHAEVTQNAAPCVAHARSYARLSTMKREITKWQRARTRVWRHVAWEHVWGLPLDRARARVSSAIRITLISKGKEEKRRVNKTDRFWFRLQIPAVECVCSHLIENTSFKAKR